MLQTTGALPPQYTDETLRLQSQLALLQIAPLAIEVVEIQEAEVRGEAGGRQGVKWGGFRRQRETYGCMAFDGGL